MFEIPHIRFLWICSEKYAYKLMASHQEINILT
jgi:hypothetical protein